MSDLEYQDIAKQAISRLHQRVAQHGSQTFHGNEPPCDELSQFENETLYNLGKIVLPKLKKNLKLLSIALDPSTPQGDGILVIINAVIAILTDIDAILGELDDLIKMIGHSPNSGPRSPDKDSKIRHFTFFKPDRLNPKLRVCSPVHFLTYLAHAASFWVAWVFQVHQLINLQSSSFGKLSTDK
ncbi:hypothetical protein PSTG_09727 [Puccinia striiformis f. sp. tritici PST-78]|uniref:Uncharacterized protein n=1 Tax=Puccinia striiformis f. sp. tritici PST-78 TaxID=1165861 RepID=A0A0L0VCK8_9BASI|nr:hypothetical protein PSTG_09727 [Puccinia striiformis f. sp. tritici PST-78]